MNNKIFREKSIERVSSPEQLNDYIRVTSPSVWLVLLGIVVVLVGIIVWGIFGDLETYVTVAAITEEDSITCYVKADDIERIESDMAVWIEKKEFSIKEIAKQPMQVDESFPEYLRFKGDLSNGEWVYEIVLNGTIGENGSIYTADIVVEVVSPISFITN